MDGNNKQVKWEITHQFARWATLSAFRIPGAPIKSGKDVYAALDVVDFNPLFDTGMGPINGKEFMEWHTDAVSKLMKWDARLNVGWAAKIIAIYLKTTCYLAGFGREGLKDVIHPPIDNLLIANLKKHPWKEPKITQFLSLFPNAGIIKRIDEDIYPIIMKIFELIACECNCTLIEIEQFWSAQKV